MRYGDGQSTTLGVLKTKAPLMKEDDLPRLCEFFSLTEKISFDDLTKHSLRIPKGRIIPYFYHEADEWTWMDALDPKQPDVRPQMNRIVMAVNAINAEGNVSALQQLFK